MTRDICSTPAPGTASIEPCNVISLAEYRARKYGEVDCENTFDGLLDECDAVIGRLQTAASLRNVARVCREIAAEIRSDREARLNARSTTEATLDSLLAKYGPKDPKETTHG